jgi:hypothetical protein
MSNYAKADTRKQWFQDDFPGSTMRLSAENMVVVLHTTEGPTWPGYSGGATAPNYTGQPPLPHLKGAWRAHFPDEKSSRALENRSGGVQTNTQNSVQVELIGTCDPKHKNSWNGKGIQRAGVDYVYWPDANDAQLKWLGEFLADMHRRHGLKLIAPFKFNPYPASYGSNQGDRMTFAEWNKFAGICGHQHVPENAHGDPGALKIDKAISFAKLIVSPTPDPTPTPTPPAGTVKWGEPKTWIKGENGGDVIRLGKRIEVHSKALGLPKPYANGPDSMFSKTDIEALSRIQKKWWPSASTKPGGDADGYPGPSTFERLAADPK